MLAKKLLAQCLAEKGFTDSTRRQYASQIHSFETWLRGRPIIRANRNDMIGFMKCIPDVIGRKRALSALRCFYSFLFTNGHIRRNPSNDVRLTEASSIDPHELVRRTLLTTGWTPAALRSLRWLDVFTILLTGRQKSGAAVVPQAAIDALSSLYVRRFQRRQNLLTLRRYSNELVFTHHMKDPLNRR